MDRAIKDRHLLLLILYSSCLWQFGDRQDFYYNLLFIFLVNIDKALKKDLMSTSAELQVDTS